MLKIFLKYYNSIIYITAIFCCSLIDSYLENVKRISYQLLNKQNGIMFIYLLEQKNTLQNKKTTVTIKTVDSCNCHLIYREETF